MRYTKKELREKFGFSRDTLRLYEERGLIQPEIDPANGYRYYDDWQVNLLWDCRYYQGMGFTLAEVQEILQRDSLEELEERVARRERAAAEELRYQGLVQREHERFGAALRGVRGLMGRCELEDFEGCLFVYEREGHEPARELAPEAVAFANRHAALMKPYFWFPELEEGRYFWGSAMRLPLFEELGEEAGPAGVARLEPCRALVTCIDAGERWNFGRGLFDGLVDEAVRQGLVPAGGLHGMLVARTHEADGYHRYVRALLPVAGQ